MVEQHQNAALFADTPFHEEHDVTRLYGQSTSMCGVSLEVLDHRWEEGSQATPPTVQTDASCMDESCIYGTAGSVQTRVAGVWQPDTACRRSKKVGSG